MGVSMKYFGVLCLLCAAVWAEEECGECNRNECPALDTSKCLANYKRDHCNCCLVCMQHELQPCDLPNRPHQYGECGDYLTCSPVDDNVGQCTCVNQEVICGSDGLTYDNLCQLYQENGNRDEVVIVKSFGKCKTETSASKPVITSGPQDIVNGTGSDVAMLCEATGNPLPYILWLFTRADGTTINMPGADKDVSMNLRGGPEENQVTGWLQVMNIAKKHEGDYTCIAKNTEGDVNDTGRLKVVETIDIAEETGNEA
ncbi:insulin-like growth factor-binding protein-related protein 1 [Mizuhopecten yessoensis]|uniref:Kazal-type serine protease inhibitor domain-containing protein 1 n=1 Tax=Mizuhopecten yessoensis TaxID=6573 RepID=A0A210PYA0_MIZYE|nr:insulin-like growth factor-binding protein-related protein 1 [Mizuhopecten yessoensis]OWF41461.1 Kazal-type serine protease inhibitor domain-containing protein 1 [Mizuhopecten yessoensis]